MIVIRFVVLAAAALVLAGCSETVLHSGSSAMATSGYAFAPPAARTFCARQPRFCSPSGHVREVKLTDRRMADLRAVNSSVNARVSERNDSSAGLGDDWRIAGKQGDCEDIAILKKSELMKRGWPASALLLTVVTLGGAGHTVLTVRTDKGDLILDNRTGAIRNWSQTSYRYFARQSQSQRGKWVRIES
ncbi:transglutaminase-like cysteine peptidase [Mesorhizobium sp. CU2]|uniref:transglutaminase-like cysteine peptidase n=1 Tax=unclassified Mesorhizobium TaxID=325217 RepID=UPI00387E8DD6